MVFDFSRASGRFAISMTNSDPPQRAQRAIFQGFFLAILFAFSLASLRLRARADSPNFGVSSMFGSLVVKAMPKVFSNEDLYLELDAKIRPENRFCISTFVKSYLDLLLKVYNLYLILSLPYHPMRL